MKNNLVKRISQIIGWVALGLSVILAVIYFMGVSDEVKVQANFDLMLKWTLFLIGTIILFAFLVGPIMSVITDPKSLLKGGIAIVFLIIVVGIAWSLSSADASNINIVKEVANLEKKAQMADVGLFTFYIIAGVTLLSIFVMEIKSLLKL